MKRDTAFLCPIEFKNDLPPVPVDWKFLHLPVGDESFTKYSHLALDDELRRDITLAPDLGITLDPMLMKQFRVPAERPPLEPADAALLEVGEISRARTGIVSEGANNAKVKRPDLSKALWLMNTQYISSMALPEHLGRSERDVAKQKQMALGGGPNLDVDPRDLMVQAIEASFAAAKLPPVHAQRPKDVKPVEVLSVYPDFERWPASHIRFVYEENPGMEVASVDGKSREEKIAALERALVKPYSVDAHDGSGEKQKFVALMLPADPAAADPAAADPATAAETEYEWIREYEYKLTQERESGLGTCAFYFYEKDKTARYVELDAKMSLTRRSKTAKRAEGAEWRPSKVTLKRVAPDDAEAERRVKARAAVEHPVPEDGGGGME